MTIVSNLIASERLRHAAIAIGLAIAMGVVTILRPVDITIWSLQTKLFTQEASGEIVYLEIAREEGKQGSPTQNRGLLQALQVLEDAGAARMVIEQPILRSASPEADAALRQKLLQLRDRVVLARKVSELSDAVSQARSSDPFFERDMRIASADFHTDFLGYVWDIEARYQDQLTEIPSLWAALAERDGQFERDIFPDYTIDPATVPQLEMTASSSLAPSMVGSVADKAILLGSGREVRMPEHGEQPTGMLHILAAETALRGQGFGIIWMFPVAIFALGLLFAIVACRSDYRRRLFYAVWVGSIPVIVLAAALLGVRAGISETVALVAIYAGQRAIVGYKRRHLYIDPRSRLPNFEALRRDLGQGALAPGAVVVVAKIARLDAVFATLGQTEQGRYLRLVAGRLSLGEDGTSIYYDGGKYLAFVLDASHYDDLEGHLRGLRAIASQAVTVGSRTLDVSMTFGIDDTGGRTPSNRLSSAIAAADQAREAYRPVFLISDLATDTEDWDYSLQSRLEEALSENRIGIQLQPQSDLASGEIVAAEALARWVDRERGDVPPARFISQCERVGRLDELTKRVLTKSLDAAEGLAREGLTPQISVNVSAIQFVDDRIAGLVEQELALHSVDPRLLTIELTETARIEDFATARSTIERIKRAGVRFAIDDFGVASANLEAMFELPFDELKIDRLFVRQLEESALARSIVANLVRLARDTGIVSIAEGVENRSIYDVLKNLGCERGQGFFIARPMNLSEFQETMRLQIDNGALRRKLG